MANVRLIVRPLVRAITRAITGDVSRFFTILASAGSQHYTAPTWTATGDFEIELDFESTTTGVKTDLIGATGSNRLEVVFESAGTITIWDGSAAISGVTNVWLDGKLHTLKVARVGTAIDLYIDGVSEGTGTSSNTITVDTIATKEGSTLFFTGIIANVSLTEAGGDNRFYAIDEDWVGPSTVLVDSVGGQNGTAVNITSADAQLFDQVADGWTGPELVVNGGFDTDTDWAKGAGWTIGGGVASQDGTGGFSVISQSTMSNIVGAVYNVEYDLVSTFGDPGFAILEQLVDTTGVWYGTADSNGRKSRTVLSDSTLNRFASNGVGAGGSVDNVSVKQFLEVA